MDKAESIKSLKEIDNQIPNPYLKNVWYDIIMHNGINAQAMRTKTGYLRIRKLTHHVVKSPDGTILHDQGMQYSYFRCNMITGEITVL